MRDIKIFENVALGVTTPVAAARILEKQRLLENIENTQNQSMNSYLIYKYQSKKLKKLFLSLRRSKKLQKYDLRFGECSVSYDGLSISEIWIQQYDSLEGNPNGHFGANIFANPDDQLFSIQFKDKTHHIPMNENAKQKIIDLILENINQLFKEETK
mgnify:CR=1 FL=1